MTRTPPDDPHAPVSNAMIELDGDDADEGEGGDDPQGSPFAPGTLAALGLETLPGWTMARLLSADPDRLRAEAHEVEGEGDVWRPRAIDSLLAPADGYTQESIIGKDERVRLHQTHRYPWRAICELRIHAKTGEVFAGTGWFAGPNTVITAGHCVHLERMGGWAASVELVPGRDGDDRPYSSIRATQLRSVRGWTVDAHSRHDYGAILLPKGQGLPEVGSFATGVYSDACLRGAYLNLAGYPADKPLGTAWWMARRAKTVDADQLHYDIDTAIGQSGAPVWMLDHRCRRRVVGIHTSGSSLGNSATRITAQVLANIRRWVAEGNAG